MRLMPSFVLSSLTLVAPAALYAQQPNDAQIAAIVVTANQVDIDAGKLAESKAKNAEVKAFGQQMITDHTGVNKQADGTRHEAQVKPRGQRRPARASRPAAPTTSRALKTLSGAAFDKAYVDHEVAYHQQVLDAMDKTLIPSAENAELKALLVKVRPAFVAHLEHAKQVQQSLGH